MKISELAIVTIDTVKSLARFRTGEHYTNYHVRAVYTTSSGFTGDIDPMESIFVDEPLEDPALAIPTMDFVGYAVYGCAPEGMYVCGDDLSFSWAARIARHLNRHYNNSEIVLDK